MLPLSKVNGWIGTLRELTPLREPNSSHSILGMTALTVAPTWIHADLSDAIEKNIVKIVGTILHARSRRSNSGGQVEEYVDDMVWYVRGPGGTLLLTCKHHGLYLNKNI